MMKSGRCPKCSSDNVYMRKDGLQESFTIVLGFANTKQARTDDYICLNCGYFERYIENISDFQDIAGKWNKVR
jgi:predicted nucleic-acid-binding Zn-ribbon protein